MDITNTPEWFEGLKWVIAAFLIALAITGPKIFGPLLQKWKALTPQPAYVNEHIIGVGSALIDKESVGKLTEALHRLSDILEKKYLIEKEENDEDRLKRMVAAAIKEHRG